MTNVITLADNLDLDTVFPSLDDSTLCFPVVERSLRGISKTGENMPPIETHKGVYRAIDGQPECLGVVGKAYKVLPNAMAYAAAEAGFIQSMTPGHMVGATVTERSSYNGGWSERVYTFPAIKAQLDALGGAKSKIGFQARIQNSYDGSSSLRMITGLIDFYCDNGMILGSMINKSNRRHTAGLSPDYVGDVITDALGHLQAEIRFLQHANQTKIDDTKVVDFMKANFSETRAEKLTARYEVEAAERGDTMWALYSALTYYSSHNSEEFPVRNTGNDNVARTLSNRSDEIARVIQADQAFTYLRQEAA